MGSLGVTGLTMEQFGFEDTPSSEAQRVPMDKETRLDVELHFPSCLSEDEVLEIIRQDSSRFIYL